MIDYIGKIFQSTIDNLVDSLGFILIIVFYELSVLQLPVPEIFHMIGIVLLFTFGLNTILTSHNKARVRHHP